MADTSPSWMSNAAVAIRGLADRPGMLFALLLALNAVARPCSVTAHDARLYSLQALNQAEAGAYASDVFLSYGSQDQFSLFSAIVGPMVATLGLRLAFFALYLVFNTLFLLALFRLVRALIDDPVISTLALVFLDTAPLSYGGHGIFMVHEQFFTPRTIGTTLTLFALERLLHKQFAFAFALLLVGSLMHPLMTFGGVLIAVGFVACSWLPTRVFAGLLVAATLGCTLVLALPAVGTRLFGSMDDDWHQLIRVAVGYNYPDTWQAKDWLNLAVSFALPVFACTTLFRDDPLRRRFFLIVILAGVAGLLVTVAASMLPYALLFQGQSYRVLWILKVLQVPLGFLVIVRGSQSSVRGEKMAALALIAFFCVTHYVTQELLIIAWIVPLALAYSFLFERATQPDWWWQAIARSFVLGSIGWMAFRWCFYLSQRDVFAQHFDLSEWLLFDLVSPIACILAVCFLAQALPTDRAIAKPQLAGAFLVIACVTPLGFFATENSEAFRRDHTCFGSDIAFVREFVARRGEHPTIYSAFGRPHLVWIDARANSYFDIIQTAGVMFNRRTAQEIDRRAELVGKFEMHGQRDKELFLDDAKKAGMENLFKVPFDCPEPTSADLTRLCQDPGLDLVVIPQEFPGLYSAANGRVFVYECRKIRAALSPAPPQATVAAR